MPQHNSVSNPGVAAVLSFVFNGLGQIYNGQITKGLIIIFLSFVSLLIFIAGSIIIGWWLLGKALFGKLLILGITLFLAGLLLICCIALYSIFDAYQVASRK
ncbi:MAG: hypothetical protein C4540_02975 [Candidatus Omnitrophota bacterium]|jgi:TM2 domain-containing membrane protein YozV|nr:MAG: hypothetical protein C4540_02975 [Candidatus Omnitrophota bacterium]